MMKRRYDRWTPERTARAAFLVGRGLTHAEAGGDPGVAATGKSVQMALARVGISAIGEAVGDYAIRLPPSVMKTFEDAARARAMTTDKAFREAMRTLAGDKSLLDNVFDDGVTTP
jgi:hypothetical protein